MGTLWPDLPALPSRCARCRKLTARDKLVQGYGRDCAERLGLISPTVRVHHDPQTGTDLLDHLPKEEPDDEPDDCCDGHDRPQDA